MTIETKYDIKEKVWVLSQNKVLQGFIEGITVNYYYGLNNTTIEECIFYLVHNEANVRISQNSFSEKKVFTSKEELIKSL